MCERVQTVGITTATSRVTRLSNVHRSLHILMAETIQPNTTLYINNLNDKINKDEIRSQLFALFTTYGKLIDVVATKTPKMRGQAFLVFTDLASATAALRACDGMTFYDKPMVRFFISSYPVTYTRSVRSASHMQKASPMRLCVVKTPTLFPPTLPTPLLRSACVRQRSRRCAPNAREQGMRTARRWTSMMTMKRVPPLRVLLTVCRIFLLCLVTK